MRKNVNTEFISKDNVKTYKKILSIPNAHLADGKNNFRDIIAPLFAIPKGRGVESALRRKWTKY